MFGHFIGFEGRVTRGTWWAGYVFSVFLVAIAWMLLGVATVDEESLETGLSFNIASLLCSVLALVISSCVTVKRYHDLNKSGIWSLIGFIPFLNFWQWAECGFFLGDDGPNRFGPPPGYGGCHSGFGRDGLCSDKSNAAMAKLDDDYMAEYARKIAQQKSEIPNVVGVAQQPVANVSTGSIFGKR